MTTSKNKIHIEYDSGPIPPPFCHRFHIEIEDKMLVKLDLQYYDRDEISIEEIYDEGFTENDDFKWEGKLPDLWWDETLAKVNNSNWKKGTGLQADGSVFYIKRTDNASYTLLQPADCKNWLTFAQEIIQAVFEKSQKEAPLYINFIDQHGHQTDLSFSFAHRHIEIKGINNRSISMNWRDGQKLLKYIFTEDYYPEEGSDKRPKGKGNYISPGDGLWYLLTPEKYESEKEKARLRKLIKTLSELGAETK